MSTENNSTAVAEEIPNLLITPTAQEYLKDLLDKQNTPGIGVRVFVENPGTPRAECCMAYSAPEEVVPTDYKQDYPDFPAFVDAPSIPYLLDAVIDYNKDRFTYVLQSEINPGLAGHGGNCALVEVVEDAEHGLTAVLKFGGGCQGCSSIDLTLKQGVETTLKQHVPELARVVDQTDHSNTEGAYFK